MFLLDRSQGNGRPWNGGEIKPGFVLWFDSYAWFGLDSYTWLGLDWGHRVDVYFLAPDGEDW